MIYIIAGNYQQSEHHRRHRKLMPKNVLYVSSADKLRGRIITENDEIVQVGTWYERKDMRDIKQTLRLCKLRGDGE